MLHQNHITKYYIFVFIWIIYITILLIFFTDTANIKNVTLKSGNLTCLELFQLFNKHVSALVPVAEPVANIQTKLEKKGKRK